MTDFNKYFTVATSCLLSCTNGTYTPQNIVIHVEGREDEVKERGYDCDNVNSDAKIEEQISFGWQEYDEAEMQEEVAQKCEPKAKRVCKNNIQFHWQDSCGTLEEKIEECGLEEECKEGKCICMPKCYARFCGEDGCGGVCGTCLLGESCVEDTVCMPKCEGKKEWENSGFNAEINWKFGCTFKKFVGLKKIGDDYLATVIGEGYFSGGQFVLKINASGEPVWIEHFYGKVIEVFPKEKSYLAVVDHTLTIECAKEVVYLTELCTINEDNLNTIFCVAVDKNTTSKRKVNTALQVGKNVLLAGTYEKGVGSCAYLVENEEKIVWVKTYNGAVKDEITSIAVHPQGYFLWGKKEGKDTLKLADMQGDLVWEKGYDFGMTDTRVLKMDTGMYGVYGYDVTKYFLLDTQGVVVMKVDLQIPNGGTQKYLFQTQVELAGLLSDGSFVGVGQQDNPTFGSWVAHFGTTGKLDELAVLVHDAIEQIAVTSEGYMAVGAQWSGSKNVEWWMKKKWCEK